MHKLEGGGGSHGCRGGILSFMCEVRFVCNLTCQPNSQFWILVRPPIPQSTGESSSADRTWVRSHNRYFNLTFYPPPYMLNGFVPFILTWFDSISWVRPGLPSLAFHRQKEQTEKKSCWSWQCLPCLSLLIVYHQDRSVAIGSYLEESMSASSSFTSMMASACWSHKTWIITSTLIYFSLSIPLRISFSDMVQTWWIRVSAHTDARVKYRRTR